MYYLSDIKDNIVGSTLQLPSEDYIGYLGWDKTENEKTGIFIDELPENKGGVLCADLDTKKVWYEISIEQLKENKRNEIVSISTAISQQGIDYEYNGVTSHYALTIFDVACITTRANDAKQGKTVSWHADDGNCRLYTPEEFLGLYATAMLFTVHHQTYSNCLKHQVEEMESIEEINAVVYGETTLNEEKQQEYNTIMANERANLGLPEQEG